MEQPEDRADRGAGDAAAGGPRRDPDDDDTFGQRLYRACFLPVPEYSSGLGEGNPACTGGADCPVPLEPDDYEGHVDWLREH